MRMAEILARYAGRGPRRREALLIWQVGEAGASEREALYPSRGTALRAARALMQEPDHHAIWVYDGRRLYDGSAIERLWQRRES